MVVHIEPWELAQEAAHAASKETLVGEEREATATGLAAVAYALLDVAAAIRESTEARQH